MKRRRFCTDRAKLLAINEYSFDLNNDEFLDFCMVHGLIHLTGTRNSISWEFTRNFALGKEDFFNHRVFQFSITGYRYSESEMEDHWRIMVLARGCLQDAWEVFNEITEEPVLTGSVNPPPQIEQLSMF